MGIFIPVPQGTNRDKLRQALVSVASRLGYTVRRGGSAGQGSLFGLCDAIAQGKVLVVPLEVHEQKRLTALLCKLKSELDGTGETEDRESAALVGKVLTSIKQAPE